MKRFSPAGVLSAALVLFPVALGRCPGAELIGSTAILKRIAEGPKNAAAAEASPASRLASEVKSFPARAATLDPKAAAAEWLSLADRVAALQGLAEAEAESADWNSRMTLSGEALLAALPPPAAWEEIIRAIRARPDATGPDSVREAGLRLLADVLANQPADQFRGLAQLQAAVAALPRPEARALVASLEQTQRSFLEFHGDSQASVAAFERNLDRLEQGAANPGYLRQLQVPDLVTLVGPDRAEVLLRRVLKLDRVPVRFWSMGTDNEETLALARRLALEMMSELKQPHWSLCESVEAVALYEAFEKRFGASKPKAARLPVPDAATQSQPPAVVDPATLQAQMEALRASIGGDPDLPGMLGGRRGAARAYYLMGLILAGRQEDAAAVARRFGHDASSMELPAAAVRALDRAGRNGELDEFLFRLLSADSHLPFWPPYFEAAARAGTTDRMLTLAQTAAAQPDLRPADRVAFRHRLARALLAADHVEAGVQELRELLKAALDSGSQSVPGLRRMISSRYPAEFARNDDSPAMMLAQLGAVLGQATWLDEGLAALLKQLTARPAGGLGFDSADLTDSVVDLLVDAGRLPEAEEVLADQLARMQSGESVDLESFGKPFRKLLTALCRVYHRADRPADVLAVLEQSPQWGVEDLVGLRSDLVEEPSVGHDRNRRPAGDSIGYFAAASLAKLGRREEALRLVDAMLDQAGGYDPAFELLLDIGGPTAAAELDALASGDPFEERPLIWKAEMLRRAGRLEEAERAARAAVRIDPSDGEQGVGRRMRAYAVLAEIRQALGDAREAGFFRGVVRAIRKSEEADRLHDAGLLLRAVALYRESLTEFADAYCIQSRLAVQLSDLGLHDEAAKHYERAFELMPDSFGRVESHCFGCERAFGSGTAQGVAERVFTKLVEKTPNKPQVHYLLGFLRSEQGRHREALDHYRKAVQLDPDYLNAWLRLAEAAKLSGAPTAERDAAILAAYRLDPSERHGGIDLALVADLRALWDLAKAAQKRQAEPPSRLLPLTASAERMARRPSPALEPRRRAAEEMSVGAERGRTPGEVVSRQQLMQSVGSLIGGGDLSSLGY